MRVFGSLLPFVAATLGFVAAACGGATLDPGTDGGSDSSPPPSDGGLVPACPTSAPTEGAACTPEGVSCEYGNDPSLQCNVYAQCSLGHWQVNKPTVFGCPTPPNDSACPGSYASVPVGQACGALVGTTCSYPQGFCGCAVPQFGPYPEDASAAAVWVCDQPEPGCPQPRPKLGSACTQENQACDYGTCSLPTGTSMICKNGAWENAPFGCAL
jgi:hypothetical protein